jgi:hypothetical protein
LNRQKSMISQAESISAWNAVFDCPSIVAALIVSRHDVVRSSAAFSSTAARSSNDHDAHSCCAVRAASTACSTCFSVALWYSPRTCACSCGITDWPQSPVFTSLPPMISGMSTFSLAIAFSLALSDARSGLPGAYERIGSLTGGGTRRCPLNATYEGDDIACQCNARVQRT